jgi:hypothetical protein
VNVAPESIWILQGMGTHVLQVQLEVGIPQVTEKAGRLLYLETALCAPEGSGPRSRPSRGQVNLPVPVDQRFCSPGARNRVTRKATRVTRNIWPVSASSSARALPKLPAAVKSP